MRDKERYLLEKGQMENTGGGRGKRGERVRGGEKREKERKRRQREKGQIDGVEGDYREKMDR